MLATSQGNAAGGLRASRTCKRESVVVDRVTMYSPQHHRARFNPPTRHADTTPCTCSCAALQVKLLRSESGDTKSAHFGHDLIPSALQNGLKVVAHHFGGYWRVRSSSAAARTHLLSFVEGRASQDVLCWVPVDAVFPALGCHATSSHAEIQ